MAEVTEPEVNTSEKLMARELPSAVNSKALLEEHAKINGSVVRTRFPPEPNGYLHVGHAKSMNMNFEVCKMAFLMCMCFYKILFVFQLAFEKLGVAPENRETIFRYDDTNPEAESKEYIQSLRLFTPNHFH
jgi:glutaminyl-tRNA synthetase